MSLAPPHDADGSAPAASVEFELVDPAGRRTFAVDDTLELGRTEPAFVVHDATVSARHLRLDVVGGSAFVTDLGSSNGTFVGGVRLTERRRLDPGDEVRLGASALRLVRAVSPVAGRAPGRSADVSGSLRTAAIEVRFAAGGHAETVAPAYAAAAARARRALQGFGSEPWGVVPVVHLVDPYLDEDGIVTTETSVDPPGNQAWVVVTPQTPVEPPHRVLALLFGGVFPAAEQLHLLVEGYGLHLGDAPDTDEQLRGRDLPALDVATGDDRTAMSVSFVRFLLAKEGTAGLGRVFGSPPGQLDETVRDVYGMSLGQLERLWWSKLESDGARVRTVDFLRLSWHYLRPYRWRQAEIFLYMLLSLAFTASFPFVTQRLFDTALPSGEFGQVLSLLIGLGVAFVVSLVASVRQAYQTAWVSTAITRDMRQSIFDRLQVLPSRWFADHPQGDVLSRLFSDVGAVQNGLSEAIGQGVFQMVSLVVAAVIMLSIDLVLGAVVLVVAPLVGLVYKSMAAGALERSLAVQQTQSVLLGVAAENHRAMPVVRVFGLAGRERRRFAAQSDRVFRSMRRLTVWGGMFGLSVNLLVTLLRLAVLGLGAWMIIEGHFTTGGLVAFLSIMGEVLSPVTVLVSLGQDVQASMGSLMRIDEVLHAAPEPDDDLPDTAPLAHEVRLVSVGMSYTPDRRALDGVDVPIRVGTRVAFVGSSGSGKSSVMRLLMRLHEPDDGAILVDGVDLRATSLASWRSQLGVVFQDSFLFDATLRENIALGRPGATEDEVRAAARAAGVEAFVESLDRGWDTLVGENGSNLSGGQRQRVAIARALLRSPRLLLLDEATSALDPATERQINETIESISRGRTVVSVTHRLASVQEYDQIVVMADGRVAEVGRHAELLARRGEYARLWAEQTGAPLPPAPPFDPLPSLRRLPFLHGLDDARLAGVAASMVQLVLEPGRAVAEGDGVLVVASGRGHASSPGSPPVVLRPGDAFGVPAVLGAPATATLVASETMDLLHLSGRALRELAQRVHAVGAALSRGTVVTRPRGATRLGRLTAMHAAGGDTPSRLAAAFPPPPLPPTPLAVPAAPVTLPAPTGAAVVAAPPRGGSR